MADFDPVSYMMGQKSAGGGGGGGGGGSSVMDVVIEASSLEQSAGTTFTLVSGDYADVKSKLQSHLPVTGLVYSEAMPQQASVLGEYLVQAAGSNPEFIVLYFLDEATGRSVSLQWYPDGTIELDW